MQRYGGAKGVNAVFESKVSAPAPPAPNKRSDIKIPFTNQKSPIHLILKNDLISAVRLNSTATKRHCGRLGPFSSTAPC